jgi:hypothetical protein
MPDYKIRADQTRRRAEGLAAIRLRYCIIEAALIDSTLWLRNQGLAA